MKRALWKLWNGWGPHTDGLMRVERIGPEAGGGLQAFDGTVIHDICGTREDLEAVVAAMNASFTQEDVERLKTFDDEDEIIPLLRNLAEYYGIPGLAGHADVLDSIVQSGFADRIEALLPPENP